MKMLISISALVLVTSSIVAGQRPFFAGSRPIGFPETPNRTTTTPDPLGDRFGEGTTERLPIEANGDRDLIDRLSKLPIDKQPFWFINWQALEAHRKDPQTYPQRPNSFVDPIPVRSNTGLVNNRFSTPNPGFISTDPVNFITNRFGPTTISKQPSANVNSNSNSGFVNRNGEFVQTTPSIYNQQSANVNPNSGYVNSYGQFVQGTPGISNQQSANVNSNSGFDNRNGEFTQTTPSISNQQSANVNSNSGYVNSYGQFVQGTPGISNQPNANVNSNSEFSNSYGQFVQGTSGISNQPSANDNSNSGFGNSNGQFVQGTPSISHQHSSANVNSNSESVHRNGEFVQTTHKYKWNSFVSHSTNYRYPEYYSQTDTNPKRTGHDFF